MKRSGHRDNDEIRLATAPLNKKVSQPNEDIGKPFRFLQCWELLWDMPKIMVVDDAIFSNNAEKNPWEKGTNISTGDEEEKPKQNVRPDGRRKAKDDLATQKMRSKKILLFTNGPGGLESEMAKGIFCSEANGCVAVH